MRRFLILLAILLFAGCGNTSSSGRASPASGQPLVEAAKLTDIGREQLTLPNHDRSIKFAIIGDSGRGSKEQHEVAAQMEAYRQRFDYKFVLMAGDNIYEGPATDEDYRLKFEEPYKPLLDAGVKFYASLGNHDAREQRYYKLFNMDGKLYYSFKPDKQSVRFFALESTYLDPEQIAWLEKELQNSNSEWKIPYFHHPPYSSGDRHGSDTRLREVLEPLFLKYGVSVVLTGHDHFYERVKPQKGIVYFVAGSGGQLRKGNIDKRSGLTAAGNDQDYAFMICEINGDQMWFDAISRKGGVFDSGVITRRK